MSCDVFQHFRCYANMLSKEDLYLDMMKRHRISIFRRKLFHLMAEEIEAMTLVHVSNPKDDKIFLRCMHNLCLAASGGVRRK